MSITDFEEILKEIEVVETHHNDVFEYLRTHSHLVAFISEGLNKIENIFGDAQISMAVDYDPDDIDWSKLVIIVKYDYDEGIEFWEEFVSNWVLKHLDKFDDEMSFTFVPA